MHQLASTLSRVRTPSRAFLHGGFNNDRVTRPMLLQACRDVEHELQRLLRRQRWMRLGKLLRRSIGF
ncbi:hypothetical protein SAMN05216296_1581 [Pseudomonas pohangensis]|uniref:Uncharacterized protein n=1 Tax=Pseudomonas pohangensis TaxID=364197 RepID=A0A1H2FH73_9PSED|nr:hypothetical protein [Pseudomonas pohangensis]SDU06707.1 hypothetical protein SAMN05216296_1581 [Pseudomonas pohangensis]